MTRSKQPPEPKGPPFTCAHCGNGMLRMLVPDDGRIGRYSMACRICGAEGPGTYNHVDSRAHELAARRAARAAWDTRSDAGHAGLLTAARTLLVSVDREARNTPAMLALLAAVARCCRHIPENVPMQLPDEPAAITDPDVPF